MLYCHESDCLLFLASPLVDGLEALTSRGLFISDIPIHDATRDIVLIGEQARAQVRSFPFSFISLFFLFSFLFHCSNVLFFRHWIASTFSPRCSECLVLYFFLGARLFLFAVPHETSSSQRANRKSNIYNTELWASSPTYRRIPFRERRRCTPEPSYGIARKKGVVGDGIC